MIKLLFRVGGSGSGTGAEKAFMVLAGALLMLLLLAGCSEGGEADMAATDTAVRTGATASTAASGVQDKIEKKAEPIPFETEYEEDASINLGEYEVRQEGQEGTKEATYKVTYTDGIETARELVSEVVIKVPVARIEAVGTRVTHHEDPTATTTTSTTSTTQQSEAGESSCPAGVVAICADGTVSMGTTNPSIPICAGRGGVARTCP